MFPPMAFRPRKRTGPSVETCSRRLATNWGRRIGPARGAPSEADRVLAYLWLRNCSTPNRPSHRSFRHHSNRRPLMRLRLRSRHWPPRRLRRLRRRWHPKRLRHRSPQKHRSPLTHLRHHWPLKYPKHRWPPKHHWRRKLPKRRTTHRLSPRNHPMNHRTRPSTIRRWRQTLSRTTAIAQSRWPISIGAARRAPTGRRVRTRRSRAHRRQSA